MTEIQWLAAFPELDKVRDPVWMKVAHGAKEHVIPPGTVLFKPGALSHGYPFVIEGCIRVTKESAGGREILLYRVEPGQVCLLSTASLMTGAPIMATAVTEVLTRLAVIRADRFQYAFENSKGFCNYVTRSYAQRFRELVDLIDGIAFGRVDARLAKWLLANGADTRTIRVSHDRLATELGTAREVVSRQLKDFEGRGWVKLARGRIGIVDINRITKFVRNT